jgi:hypothetical protein
VKRALRLAAIAIVAFAAFVAFGNWLHGHGFVATTVMREWGEVVLYADGKGSFQEFVATYPPLAFALDILAGIPARALWSLPPPLVTSAAVAGWLVASWVAKLRRAHYGQCTSIMLVALVCLHPFFLYLVTTGVDAVLLLVAIYWFATAFCEARARGRVTDFMNLALAFAFMAFAHPLGARICLIALPFLVFALPVELVARSAFYSLLVLLFPAFFGVASFAYGNALFEGSATAFLVSVFGRAPLPVPASNVLSGLPHSAFALGVVAVLAASTLVAAMPAAIALASRVRQVEGHGRAIATLSVIALLAVVTTWLGATAAGGEVSPSTLLLVSAPFVALAIVAAHRWTAQPRRTGTVAVLLAAGVLLAWCLPFPWISGEPMLWRTAVLGTHVEGEEANGKAALARYLVNRNDVLLDVHAHPAVLAVRGSTRGLVVPGDDAFTQTVLTRLVHARYIAVPDSDDPTMADDDLLAQTFPTLYQRGIHGYRLAFDANGWRVYERSDTHQPG